eukprot:213794_1
MNSKSTRRVTYPLELNMNGLVYNANGVTSTENPMYSSYGDDGPYKYSLRWVIIHSGTLQSGHYKCLSVDINGKCHLFSDNKHRPCGSGQYTDYFGDGRRPRCETAYILEYVKVESE